MYAKEIQNTKLDMFKSFQEIDKLFTQIKIDIHTLDKLGFDMKDFYKQMDDLGIELYKAKNMVK